MSPSPGLCLQQQQQQHREMTPPSPYQCPPPPSASLSSITGHPNPVHPHSAYDAISLGYPPRHHSPCSPTTQNVNNHQGSGGGYTMNGTLTAYGSVGTGSSTGKYIYK
jgi:hypothetical protein